MFRFITRFIFTPALILFSLSAVAETQYITEELSTFMRSGAGDQYRITGTIKAGTPVEVVEQRGKYTLVKTPTRGGWVLTSEVSNQPSSKLENPQLKAKIEELTTELNNINGTWETKVADMKRRTGEAENQSNSLINQNEQLKIELEKVKNINKNLKIQVDSEQQAIAIQYFIYGGTVLAIGFILGLILPYIIPSKKRKPNGWA